MDWNTIGIVSAASVVGFIVGYQFSQLNQNPVPKLPTERLQNNYDDNDVDELMSEPDEEAKMVLVVRMDLKMGKGKQAAQIAHAALGGYKKGEKHNPAAVERWDSGGRAKVVVKVQDEKELLEVQQLAKKHNVVSYLVMDAGRTQIAAGSKTVLCVGPDTRSKVDLVTGHLKLL